MSDRKLFVLANFFAGHKKIDALTRRFRDYLRSKDVAYHLFDTDLEKNATDTIVSNLDSSFTDLVIIGGDGTINEAINGLTLDIPVGIVPAGTGDDFIKNLHLGDKLYEQFETAVEGDVIAIDLGLCNDRKFVNGVGIGFDGQIVEDMHAKRVPILKGHAAYYYHVLRILGGYRERPFTYQIDGNPYSKDLILLTVANGTTFGGGFKLTPKAKVDDGMLEVCEVSKLSPIKRFLNIHRLSNGTHGALDTVKFYQAKEVVVEKNPLLYAHIDGERMGQPPFTIKILPKALKVRVRRP